MKMDSTWFSPSVSVVTEVPVNGSDNDPRIICPACNANLDCLELVWSHLHNIHNVRNYEYICYKCARKFPTKSLLQRHVREHEHDFRVPYKCDVCGNDCVSEDALKIHMLIGHGSGAHLVECRICALYVKRKDFCTHLRRHILEVQRHDQKWNTGLKKIKLENAEESTKLKKNDSAGVEAVTLNKQNLSPKLGQRGNTGDFTINFSASTSDSSAAGVVSLHKDENMPQELLQNGDQDAYENSCKTSEVDTDEHRMIANNDHSGCTVVNQNNAWCPAAKKAIIYKFELDIRDTVVLRTANDWSLEWILDISGVPTKMPTVK